MSEIGKNNIQSNNKPAKNQNNSKPTANKNSANNKQNPKNNSQKPARPTPEQQSKDFLKNKDLVLAMISGLDPANRDDRRLFNTIQNSARVGEMGVKYESAGTMIVNYNSIAVRDTIQTLQRADTCMRVIAEKISSTNYRNEISFTADSDDIKKHGMALETEIKAAESALQTAINKALALGYGNGRDVEAHQKEMVREAKTKIEELVREGKTIQEIAEQTKIPQALIQNSYNNIISEYINEKMEEIQNLVVARKTMEEIAKTIKVEPEKIAKIFAKLEKSFYYTIKDEIMKAFDAGKTIKDIAKTHKVDEEKLTLMIPNWKAQQKTKVEDGATQKTNTEEVAA